MAKKVDPLKAKAAKQKKIAIGGCVLLLALLGFQGPKTLKMLKGPQALPTPTATAPATTTPAAAAPGGTAAGQVPADPTAAPAPELSAVADSDLSPAAEQGQLATFERFASKDPFAQQAEAEPTAPAAAAPTKDTETSTTPDQATSAASGTDAGSTDAGATDGGFTTGGSAASDGAAVAATTSISVNGVAEDVAVAAAFPKDEPTFVLVKIAKNGKSVEIGIAGGEYAGGGETITLALGKKLTLQNTADGSRYELQLLTIQGRPVPKKK
jgi:hypothetical protein